MSIYRELPSATYREIGGIRYFVRKFGFNGVVIEEELHPVPTEKTIRIMKIDGSEDVAKRKPETLKL